MTDNPAMSETKKDPATTTATDEATDDAATASKSLEDGPPDLPHENVQYGVHDVEAVTLSWSRASLIFVFAKYVLLKLSLLTDTCVHVSINPASRH